VDGSQHFGEVLKNVSAELDLVRQHKTYARDVGARYRELRPVLEQPGGTKLSVWAQEISELTESRAAADADLTFAFTKEASKCLLWFKPAVIEPDAARSMLEQFSIMLEGLVANREQSIAYFPLLSREERQRLVVQWNQTAADFPADSTIPRLFEEQVKQSPQSIAVVFEGKQVTYRELNARANQLARHLRSLGVGPDALVGICVERSLDMIVGLLAILKAGGAYVPFDPTYPKERIAFQLEDAEVGVLLTQADLVPELPPLLATAIRLDTDWECIGQENAENLPDGPEPDHLAYVIYTSGSTGKPKGVLVPHRAICNHLHWGQASDPVLKEDRVLQKTSISFDVSVWEIFGPLLAGACLVVSRNVNHGYDELVRLIIDQKITILNFVPSALSVFLEESGVEKCKSLRRVFCGGEVLSTELQQRFFSVLSADLHNSYGVTEAAVDSVFWICQRKHSYKTIPIGRPIANTQIYLLDSYLQPVPVGVPGEIHIGGVGLARGYLKRPELTAQRFIADPFSQQPGARLYKTGDLGRYLPDGNIELIGRIDQQVKVRGFRIELGEIESVLSQHPGVREALVTTREDSPGDLRLVAYVIPASKPPPGRKALLNFLKEKLPGSMVPGAFVLLDSFPLLPNGKVNRQALPAPDKGRSEVEANFVAPRDSLETQLAKIWEKLLNLRTIGVRDSFFDLGGNSLLAARLFSQIEKVCAKKLPLATLFQFPTIEQLATALRQEGWAPSWSSLVPIQPRGSRSPLYFIHGVGGNILNFRDLARHLAPDLPLYGLQSQGLDGRRAPFTRIEDMAAHYIEEIRSLQPDGPYHIGGMSFGGMVAYEMAQQLHAHGEEVALLAMLDTDPHEYTEQSPTQVYQRRLESFSRRMQAHWETVSELRAKEILPFLRAKLRTFQGRMRHALWQNLYKFYQRIGHPLPKALRSVQEANYLAAEYYTLKPYPGTLTYFRALDNTILGIADPEAGWRGLVLGGVEVYDVPGDHLTLLEEPHVRILAQALRDCLGEGKSTI
jgi:amino acid adenylation domain-containing protein